MEDPASFGGELGLVMGSPVHGQAALAVGVLPAARRRHHRRRREVFNDKLREWEDYYNYHRRHRDLDGQTPYERLKQGTTTET
ncbi:hypothetical protein AB0M41_44295 [Streptomyces sp. NPDC051896]|uniref:hypothetical protein n=1 Tax=Streptomyces sp. NPDC051896 TaxID=3155416 RepID=UPI0034462D15